VSASSGPYSLPGVTGATTGPYAGPTVTVRQTPDGPRVLVSWPNSLSLVSGLCSDEDTAAVQAARIRKALAPLGEVEGLRAEIDQLRAALAAAATPAPPVDVAARLRAMADAANAARYYEVERGLNTAERWCERDPELAQAIARALTGEATS
jgi:hypothetical protein